jgi:protein TonB
MAARNHGDNAICWQRNDRRHQLKTGQLIALRSTQDRDANAGRDDRAFDAMLATADLHNVVPFTRAGGSAAQAPEIVVDATRLAAPGGSHERVPLIVFVALSLIVHGGLLFAAWRDPVPLASIGMEVMSIELMIGATAPAGIAQAPGENQVQAAAPEPEQPRPEEQAEQKATEQPPEVQVAAEEKAPEQVAEPEPAPAEPQPSVAMVETPKPDEAPAKPSEMSEAPAISLPPRPREKQIERKPEAKPVQAQPRKPVQHAAPAKQSRRIDAPTKERASKQAKASAPSTAANNVGAGRSDANSNYAGLVSAHLRRHQQYPADARGRGDQGTATVSFSLDGGGRVTSSRLVRGSGISSIDQEVQAMVRRASPFPAPPTGRSASFTVPVTFRLN